MKTARVFACYFEECDDPRARGCHSWVSHFHMRISRTPSENRRIPSACAALGRWDAASGAGELVGLRVTVAEWLL